MKNLVKLGLILFCAAVATASLLGFALRGILKKDISQILEKMDSETGLYVVLIFILFEFYCLINDSLAGLSRKYNLNFVFVFSEIRFAAEADPTNTPFSLRTKLLMYPLTISICLVPFIVLMAR
ncbi:hypothetical protein [Bradyrhizobium prioriisuperbiae]|uniref:hypothetical protein n=1 Tax=Bradyrhizobium prioriisuperbiae TaxID=2854389 RepID=UPI0028EBF206|nr:hypothetical protein [Bradyrhizobium prioritasuperba]